MSRKTSLLAVSGRAISGVAFAVVGASCALTFPDYPVGEGGGGAASGSTSSALAPDGAPCTDSAECQQGHCLESNAGMGSVCCAAACIDLGTESCATNGKCDPGGSGCALYPAGTICGDTTCAMGTLTSDQCQAGSCMAGEPVPCAGGLACADATTCKTTCTTAADCADPMATCPSAGSSFCVAPVGAPCASNSECTSNVCGTTGVGHCCLAACSPTTAPCGATDCDEVGVCTFPSTETACGASSTCMDGKLTSDHCDSIGGCASGSLQQPCPGHLDCADASSCLETCGSNDASGDARCAAGYWCDGATCLPSSWQGGAACERNGQCCSGDCTPIGCVIWTPCN